MPVTFLPDNDTSSVAPPAPQGGGVGSKINFIPDSHLPSIVLKKNKTNGGAGDAAVGPLTIGEKALLQFAPSIEMLNDPKNALNIGVNTVAGKQVIPNIPDSHLAQSGMYTPDNAFRGIAEAVGANKIEALLGLPKNVVKQYPADPNTIHGALALAPSQLADTLINHPEQLALAGEGAIANVARKLMAGLMLYGGGKEAVAEGASPGQRTSGVLQAMLGGLVGAHGGAEVKPIATTTPEAVLNATASGMVDINEAKRQAGLVPREKQLPERAATPLEQAKQEAQAKLESSQALPRTAESGFIVGGRGVADAGNASQVHDVTRPKALIGNEGRELPMGKIQVGSKPPFIAGATDEKGVEGVTPVTREMLDLHSGADINTEEAKKLKPALMVGGVPMVGGDTHAEIAQRLMREKVSEPGMIMDSFMDDGKHVFVHDDGRVLSRMEAAQAVGRAGELHSQDLQEFHSGVPLPKKEDWDKFKGAVGIRDGDWTHQGVKVAMKEHGFKNEDTGVDAGQLKNRVVNKLGGEGSGEVKMWKALGLDEKFKSGEVTTPKEMAQWMQEVGPKVEVRKFGEGGQGPEAKRFYQLEHEIDTKFPNSKRTIYHYAQYLDKESYDKLSPEEQKAADEYVSLNKKAYFNNDDKSHWSFAAPKAEKDMPGYVEIAVVKPLSDNYKQLAKKEESPSSLLGGRIHDEMRARYQGFSPEFIRARQEVQFPSSHYFPPNTLGFVRGYMENVKGEKVFHVVEAQSDLVQNNHDGTYQVLGHPEFGTKLTRNEAVAQVAKMEPLHPHYERLALKAAIDHARKEGATKVVISDAETAMMSEGHDRTLRLQPTDNNIHLLEQEGETSAANKLRKGETTDTGRGDIKELLEEGYDLAPSQAPGMRLHYDRTLPKIAEELTGSKGERVELGEHKMARRNKGFDRPDDEMGEGTELRSDLIFRNPDGTPKTSITGRSYSLEKLSARIASGEPLTTMGKMYSGVPIPDTKKLTDIVKRGLVILGQDPTSKTLAAMKDATTNLISKNANEKASTISGMLERATKQKDTKDSPARRALSFAVESAQKPYAEMRKVLNDSTKADPKEKTDALKAIAYAERNSDLLKPLVEKYNQLTEEEAQREETSGRSIERRKGYVMHLAEDKGDASSFVHMREYDTFADRIAAGSSVGKGGMDAVELLRTRIARGQQIYVQSRVFIENAKRIKDAEGRPMIGEFIRKERGPGKDPDIQPPDGYKTVKLGYRDVPVLDGYSGTLKALTAPSLFMENAVLRGMNEARGVSKSFKLGVDSYHLFRLTGYGIFGKLSLGESPLLRFNRGKQLLETDEEELKARAESGQIDKKDLPELLEDKKKLNTLINAGYNVRNIVDSFNQHWVEKLPVLGDFQRFLFNTFQPGVMTDVALKAFDVYKKELPNLTENAVARKVASDMNDIFGTRGRQGWFKSRTSQDALGFLALAPQWTEGRMMTEVKSLTGSASAIGDLLHGRRPHINMQARVVGSMILAYVIGNQLLNYMTTGHSTFDNEEGHELDAYIPDIVSGSAGYWLNPTANAAETLHALHQSIQRQGGDLWEAWLDFASGRMSTVSKPAAIAITGKQYGMVGPQVPPVGGEKAKYGHPSGNAKVVAALKEAIPTPIGAPELGKAMVGIVDKNTQRQIMSRLGLKVELNQTNATVKTKGNPKGKSRLTY